VILTGENRNTGRETCPASILSTTGPTLSDLVLNAGLCDNSPAPNVMVVSLNKLETNEKEEQKIIDKSVFLFHLTQQRG
jgi:hypothetical protein